MKYRPFGSTGLAVSAIGLGGVPLSVTRARPGEAEAIRVIHRAIECGVTLLDTADSYCLDDTEYGHNERLIGKALEQLAPAQRQKISVATKGGWLRPRGAWLPCGRPQHLRRQCEGSLANLRVDAIDLYQHHTPDPAVPIEESIGELARLRDEGKLRFVGVSNYSLAQLDAAQSVTRIASVQNQYSPGHREPERDGMLRATRERGLAFIPWSPLGGMGGARHLSRSQPRFEQLARQRGVSPYRVALAWLMAKGPHVIPIPGASRAATIEDSAAAAELELAPAELQSLEGEAA